MPFKPPPDTKRCTAVVRNYDLNGRCREVRKEGSDLCEKHAEMEMQEYQIVRVLGPSTMVVR